MIFWGEIHRFFSDLAKGWESRF